LTFKVPEAEDGTVVVGRSLEFPMGMPTALAVLPSDYRGQASVDEADPLRWESKYGIVGMGVFGKPDVLLDGMNTEGLTAHFLYMPGGYCTYQQPKGDGTDLPELDLIPFLLGTCSTVEQARAAVGQVNVIGADPGMGFVPPLHCLMHDKEHSIAIEFHADGIHVVDNPTGVGTNSPYLDWHLTNLRNYVGATALGPEPFSAGDIEYAPLGQGQGLNDLPTGMGPAARFVRACALVRLAEQAESSDDAERLALHILNTFDIVPGTIQEIVGTEAEPEVTIWDTVMNLSRLRYGYRTISNPLPYVVDFESVDFSQPARTQELRWVGGFVPIAA
jgi:choloylglycine hydrolase